MIYSYTALALSHLSDARTTFEVLRSNHLYVKLSKCTFANGEVEYLGHVISRRGVSIDSKKIEAMVNWRRPITIKELRGFLGLIGYYR